MLVLLLAASASAARLPFHGLFQRHRDEPPIVIGRALAEAQKAAKVAEELAEATSQQAAKAAEAALEEVEKSSQQAAKAAEAALEEVEKSLHVVVEDLEKRLQHIVDDPRFLLARATQLLEDGESGLSRVRSRVGSALSWRSAGRLIRGGGVEDLTGSWSLAERHGMDEFLKGTLGLNVVQRTAVLKAGQVQVIRRVGDNLHIVTRDIRGVSELVLPLDGRPVPGEGDGGARLRRRAYVDRGSDIVILEEEDGSGSARAAQQLSECRRSLQPDGRMHVDVRKRTQSGEVAHMRIVFSPVASSSSGSGSSEARDETVAASREAGG